jgi:molybdopterin/thiamine biosynthesis adenylyltransferase
MKLLQVGAGSGGMPVLDLVARDARITAVTLIEPDSYQPHNVVRHVFPAGAAGQPKAKLAEEWLRQRRPELLVRSLGADLLDPEFTDKIRQEAASAQFGICAVDNEPAKLAFDALMRQVGIPWTLGEVLSGGIGGFVHWFRPGGACYGCVASYLQRAVSAPVSQTPDYSQPGGPVPETSIPASAASIHVIAGLHAQITLELLGDLTGFAPGFTSLLFTMQKVPEMFEEAYRPYRFTIPRADDCLICGSTAPAASISAEDLDVELDKALARLGHAR